MALAGAGFAISWASILIILSGLNPLSIAFWRSLLTSLILMPIALRGIRDVGLRDLELAAVGGVALAIHFMSWIASLQYTPVAISVTLVSTYAAFTIPIEYLLGKPPSRLTAVGGLASMIGVASLMYVTWGFRVGTLFGDALALVGSISGALYFTAGRLARARLSTATYSALVYLTASLTALAFSRIMSVGLWFTGLRPLIYLALIVLGPTLAGHTLLNYSLRYFSASAVATVTLVEPVGSTILAYIILRQPVSTPEALAMAVTLIGVYLAVKGG